METFTKKFASGVAAILIFTFSASDAFAYPCEKFLNRKIAQIRESYVPPRFFAPRTKPTWLQRLRKQPAQGRRLSRWVTTPVSLISAIAMGVALSHVDTASENAEIAKFASAWEQDIYGASTMADWMRTGGIDPNSARDVYNQAIDQFHNHLAPLRERRADFVRLGWWSEADGQLADQIMNRLEADTNAVVVRDQLIRKIQGDPDYEKLESQINERYAASVELWITPKVNYLGKSDVEWLGFLFDPTRDKQWSPRQQQGLESIREMFDYDRSRVSFVTLIELTAKTLKYPKDLEAKFTKARSLGLPVEQSTFWRADLPIAGEVFHDGDKEIVFKDEVDRWNLIWHDPRFAEEKQQWRDGKLTDVGCLIAFGIHWHRLERHK